MRYQVATPRVVWTHVEVEAENEDDAIDQAEDADPGELCAHCTGGRLMRQSWSREMVDDPLEIEPNLTTQVNPVTPEVA